MRISMGVAVDGGAVVPPVFDGAVVGAGAVVGCAAAACVGCGATVGSSSAELHAAAIKATIEITTMASRGAFLPLVFLINTSLR